MLLVELMVQGVAGFPPQARIPLRPGHVVVRSQVPLLPLLRCALFWDGSPDDGAQALAAPGAPASRLALVLRGRDGNTWRLIRDLRGGCVLQRFDAGTQRFAQVTADPVELGPLLRAQVGVPSRKVFDSLFSWSPERWPSRQGLGLDFEGPAPAVSVAFAVDAVEFVDAPAFGNETALRAQLQALESELGAADRADRLQRRIDELAHELAGLERLQERFVRADGAVAAARNALDGFASLPDDPAALVAAGEGAAAQRQEGLARIEAEREKAERRLDEAAVPIEPHRDRRFLGGAAAGVLLLLLGAFGPWRVVALLAIPAFGFAALQALRWIGSLQQAEGIDRKRALFDERQRKVEAAFEGATAELRVALERAGVKSPAELLERVRDREAAEARLAEVEAARERLRGEPGAEGLAERLAALQAESARIEGELSAVAAGSWRSRGQVEEEIEAIRSRLEGGTSSKVATLRSTPVPGALLRGAAAPALRGTPGPAFLSGASAPSLGAASSPQAADPAAALLDPASELLGVDRQELGPRLAPRVAQYLAALADHRWSSVELSFTGGLRCVGATGAIPFASLPDPDRELAWLSVQLAVVEQHAARHRVPVIYDDPFGFLDEPHQALLARYLKGLGQRTQILHRTRLPAMAAQADAVAEAA